MLGDSVVATVDGYSGTVHWYRVAPDGLRRFRTRQLPSRSRAVTSDDRRRIERLIRARSPHLPRRLVIETPPQLSVASKALFSDEGFLWIRNTADPARPYVWTVFEPDGDVAYRLSLPAGFDLLHATGDLLYGVRKTENNAPLVQVYRLFRGG